MAKVKAGDLEAGERRRINEEFAQLILRLRNKREIVQVLVGLMTPSERLMFARRVQIAKSMLKGGTQDDIRRKMRAGFTTMRYVSDWIHTGDQKRDCWLAEQVLSIRYDGRLLQSGKRKITRTALDRYPEHRLMKELLTHFFD